MVLFKQIAACIIFTSCYVHPSRSLPPQDARAYRVFPNSPKLPESGNYHHQFQFPSRLQTYREYNAFTKPTLETISDNKKPKIQFYDGKQEDTFIPQLKTPIPSHSRTGDDIYVSPYGEAISKKRTVNIPDKVGVYYYPKPIIPFHEETTKYTNIHSKIPHPDENTYGDDVYVSSSTEATSEKVTIQIVDKVTGNDSPVPRKPFDRRTGQVNLIQQPSTLTPSDTRSGDDKYVSSSTEAILTNNTVNIPDKFCGCYNHKPSIPFDEVTKTDTPIHSTTPLPDENTNGDDVYVSAYTKATTKIDDDVTGNSNLEPREPFDVGTGKDTFDQHLTTIVPSDSGNGKDIYVSSSTEAITKNPSVNIPVEVGVYYYPKPIIPFHEETTKYTNIHSKIPHPDENTYGDDVYVSSSTEATSEKVTIQIVDKVTGNDSPVPRKPFDRRTGQVNLIQQPSTLTPSDTKSGDDKYVSSSTEAILTNNTVNIPDKFCGCYNHKPSIPFDEVTKTDTPIHSTTPLPDENTNGDDVYVSAYTKATTKIDDDVTGNSNLKPREPFDVGTGKDTFDQHLTTIVPSDSGNGKDIYVSSSTEAITKNPSVNIPVEVGVYYYPKPIIPFHEETTKYTNIHSKIPHPDENTYGDDVYVSSSTEATSEKVTIQIVDKVTGSDSPVPRKPFDRRTGQVNLIQQPSTLTPSDTRSGDDEYVSSSTEAILTNNTVNIPDKFCGCYNHKPSIPFDEVTKTDTPIHSTTPLPDENTNGDDVYVSAYSEATTKIDDDVTGNSNLEPREPFDVGTGKDTFDQHLTTIVPSDSGNGKDIYVSSSTEAITKNPSVNIPVEVGVYYYPKPIIPFHEETTKYTNIHSKIPHPDENTYGDDVYVSSSTEATSEKVTIQIVDKVTGNDSPVPRKPFDRRTGQVNLIQQPSTLTPSDTRSGDDKYVSSSTEAILTNNTVNIPDKFCGCYNHKPSIPFDEVTKTDTPIHSTTPLPDENTNGDDVYVSAYSEATTKIDDDVTGNSNLEPREPFDVGTGKDTFDQHLTTIVPSDSGNGKDIYVSSSTEAITKNPSVNIPVEVGVYYYPKPIIPFHEETTKYTNIHSKIPHPDENTYGDDVYVSSSTEATSEKVTIQIVDKVTGNDSPVPRKPFDRRTGQVNLIQQPSTLTPSDTRSGDDEYVSSPTEAIFTKNTVNIPDKFCGCYNHKPSIPFDEVTKTDTPIHSTTPLPDENTNGDDVYVSAYTEATTKIDDDVTGNSNLEPREPFDVGTGKDTFDQHLTTIVPSDSGNGKDIYVSSSTEAITKNPSVNIPFEVGVYYYPKPIIPFHEETTKYTNIHSKIPHPDENTYGDDVYVSSSTEATSEKVTIQIVDKVTGNDSPVPRKPFDRRTGQVNLIQQPSTLTPSDTRSGDDKYVSSSTEAILTNNTVNIPDKFCGCYNHKPSIPFDEVTKTDTPIHSTTPLPDENTNGDDVYVSAYTEATTKIDDDVTGNFNLEPREPFDVGTGKDTFDQHLTTIVPSDSGNGKDYYVSSSTEAIPEKHNVKIHRYYYPKPNKPWEDRIKRDTYVLLTNPLLDQRSYGL